MLHRQGDLCHAVYLIGSLRDYVASLQDDFGNFECDARKHHLTVSQHYKVDTHTHRETHTDTDTPYRGTETEESSDSDCERSSPDKFTATVCTADMLRDWVFFHLSP